jgi:hypothetical protein
MMRTHKQIVYILTSGFLMLGTNITLPFGIFVLAQRVLDLAVRCREDRV